MSSTQSRDCSKDWPRVAREQVRREPPTYIPDPGFFHVTQCAGDSLPQSPVHSSTPVQPRTANSGGNAFCRCWEATVSSVSCAADIRRSRYDSQLPASAGSVERRSFSRVGSFCSLPMSNTGPPDCQRFDLILIWISTTSNRWSVSN